MTNEEKEGCENRNPHDPHEIVLQYIDVGVGGRGIPEYGECPGIPQREGQGRPRQMVHRLGYSQKHARFIFSLRKESCRWCENGILSFRDGRSFEEFRISGLCQECQDKTFGEQLEPISVSEVLARSPEPEFVLDIRRSDLRETRG